MDWILSRVPDLKGSVVVQFDRAGAWVWPVGNYRYASPYSYGFQ